MEAQGSGTPPRPLPGPTAAQWAGRASNIILALFPFIAVLYFESDIHSAWAALVGFLGVVGVAAVYVWATFKKSNAMTAEIGAGYTTLRSLGRRRRDLWYLHPDTLAVIRPPDGPPPSYARPPAPPEDDEDDSWR